MRDSQKILAVFFIEKNSAYYKYKFKQEGEMKQ